MARIVTSHYRYKRPPRKRKAIALEVPAIVSAKNGRRQVRETAAERKRKEPRPENEAARNLAHPATNADRKPAIVTIRRRGRGFADVPDMTPEEHKRHGDGADALWRELVRRATGGLGGAFDYSASALK